MSRLYTPSQLLGVFSVFELIVLAGEQLGYIGACWEQKSEAELHFSLSYSSMNMTLQ